MTLAPSIKTPGSPSAGKLSKLFAVLVGSILFLLPWQTRLIYERAELSGAYWEYGSKSLFGLELILFAALIVFFALIIKERHRLMALLPLNRQKGGRRLLVLLGALLICFAIGQHAAIPDVAFYHFTLILEAIVIGITVVVAANLVPGAGEWLTLAFWLGGIPEALLALWQFFTQTISANKWFGLTYHAALQKGDDVVQTFGERWLRPYGSWGGPNPLGIYLAIIFIVGLYILAKASKKWRTPIIIGQMIIEAALLITFSRGAWLTAAVGAVLFAWFVVHKSGTMTKVKFGMQVIVAIIITVIFVTLFSSALQTRTQAKGFLEQYSLHERSAQYSDAAKIITEHPILGVGPGDYTYVIATTHQFTLQPVHDAYVLFATEMGLPMFAALIMVIGWFAWYLLKKNPEMLPLYTTLLAGGLTEHFLWSLLPGMALAGIIIGLILAKNTSTKNPQELLDRASGIQ